VQLQRRSFPVHEVDGDGLQSIVEPELHFTIYKRQNETNYIDVNFPTSILRNGIQYRISCKLEKIWTCKDVKHNTKNDYLKSILPKKFSLLKQKNCLLLLSLAISLEIQYFLMFKTLKLNIKNRKTEKNKVW